MCLASPILTAATTCAPADLPARQPTGQIRAAPTPLSTCQRTTPRSRLPIMMLEIPIRVDAVTRRLLAAGLAPARRVDATALIDTACAGAP